jgi:hypothetical protein
VRGVFNSDYKLT